MNHPDLTDALQPRSRVGHYRIVRLLGEGGMGKVYLARDSRLGRKVALKIVRREVLGAEEARERFVREARVTARFNHPHIVTLYDVGEHDGCPYVALEYLEGQNLWERLEEERPGLREVLRIGLAVAEALQEAHAHHVLHRDLKPQNIALPTDGRLRVLDFGLAKLVDNDEGAARGLALDEAVAEAEADADADADSDSDADADAERLFQTRVSGIRGTPHYMAPEQWRQEPGQPATDIWALGVILYELLAGAHPFAAMELAAICVRVVGATPFPSLAEATTGLPERVVELVTRCVAKDPEQRPTASEVVEVLSAELRGTGQQRQVDQSPFRGLLPFGEHHASLFFGRDGELASCLERLRSEPILPVVGPSGSGKSSFVQAGVIPRLREQGSWRILQLRPGPRPFEALAAQLLAVGAGQALSTARAASREGAVGRELSGTATALARGVNRERDTVETPATVSSVPEPETSSSDDGQLAAELRETPSRLALLLSQLAEHHRCRVLLFVDQLEELYTLGSDGGEQAAFVQAVCTAADDPGGPIRAIFTVRDDFLWRLAEVEQARFFTRVLVLRALGREALLETLERPAAARGYRWEDRSLITEMVNEIQGEAAALPLLQFAAQQVWERRDRTNKRLTRAAYFEVGGVAGALAQHADGVLAGLSAAQERVARDIFLRLVTPQRTRQVASREAVLEGLGPDAEPVLERLTTARAILVRKGREESELELIHESLIQRWERLRHWLADSHEERQFIEEVSQAALLWNKRGRPADEVWRGAALATALHRAQQVPKMPAVAAQFLRASSERARRQQRRRRALWAAAFALLGIIALAATGVSFVVTEQKREADRQRRTAQAQRRRAERERAAALQESARSALARGALIEARTKVRAALEVSDSPHMRGLWWQLQRRPLLWKNQAAAILYDVAFAPDGEHVAAAGQDRTVHVYDLRTGARTVLRGLDDQIFSVAYAPDGRRIAAGCWSGKVGVWELPSGRFLRLEGHRRAVRGVHFSPDGSLIATAGRDQTIRLWRADTGTMVKVLRGHGGGVRDVQFSPDGRLLASLSRKGFLGLWRLSPGASPTFVRAHPGTATRLRFTPDGRRIATVAADGRVKLWDRTGRLRKELVVPPDSIAALAIGPRGRLLATVGSEDNLVRLWDLATGRPRGVFEGHEKPARGVAISPDGRRVVSVSGDRTLRLWRRSRVRRLERVGGHRAQVTGVDFSPDGRWLATGSYDQTARLWEVASGRTLRVFRGHRGTVAEVAFSPSGKQLATAGAERAVRLWDVRTGQSSRVLHGHDSGVWSVAYHPTQPILASASYDGTVRLWDLVTGRERRTLRGHRSMVLGVTFSPDGKVLASGSQDRTVRLWDAATGAVRRVLTEPSSSLRGARFSPDGRRLIASDSLRAVRLWDLRARTTRIVGRFPGRVYWLAFHPDGQRMGVPLSDGTARICTLADGTCRVLRGHGSEVNYLRFSPDGRLAATTSDDRTVRLWRVADGRPLWHAPLLRRTTLELYSHRGWQRLDGTRAAPPPAAKRWARAVASAWRYAEEADDGDLLCAQTHDGFLEAWSMRRDRRLYRRRLQGLTRVAALRDRCVSLAAHTLRFYGPDGSARVLARGVSALAWDRGGLQVATRAGVAVYSATGAVRARFQSAAGATAVAWVGSRPMVGFADGALERVSKGTGVADHVATFDHLPASPVRRLLAGPAGTLIAGYADGQVGVWSLRHGTRLAHAYLHGPVVHLRLQDHRLYAASELGQHVVLDLRPFFTPYCTLLRQIWRAVPATWQGGSPRLRPPPTGHRCYATKR